MRVDQGGRLTTILTTQMLGQSVSLRGEMITNIDTGNLLMFDEIVYPDHIFEIAPGGAVTTFSKSWSSIWAGPGSFDHPESP